MTKLATELTVGDVVGELRNLSQLRFDPRQSLIENIDLNLTSAVGRADRRKNDAAQAAALRRAYAELLRQQAAGPVFGRRKFADFAPGLPRKKDYGDVSKLAPGQLLTLVRQLHSARRAGRHEDFRVGSPESGLYSWAVPRGLPEPGGRALAIQQGIHRFGYKDFQGEIPAGQYGAGTVEKIEEAPVLVTKVGPDGIHLTRASGSMPERFLLAPTFSRGSKKRNWLLVNTTLAKSPGVAKPKYAVLPADQVEDALRKMRPGQSVQAKIDGASQLLLLARGGVESLSYRTSTRTGRPIVHTERALGGRPGYAKPLPAEYAGSVLRSELYGVDQSGRAIPARELSGILHSSIARSAELQRQKGVQLKHMLFDIARRGAGDVSVQQLPYGERLKILEELLPHLPDGGRFHLPESATTPEAALELWNRVRSKRHPLTEEGVVLWPEVGTPVKAKLRPESRVRITGTFPAEPGSKYEGRGVGGFTYAGGRIGTGLSDELRVQAMQNPETFVGRLARIAARGQFPSGAYREPSLLGLHEDYPMTKSAGGWARQLGQALGKVFSRETARSGGRALGKVFNRQTAQSLGRGTGQQLKNLAVSPRAPYQVARVGLLGTLAGAGAHETHDLLGRGYFSPSGPPGPTTELVLNKLFNIPNRPAIAARSDRLDEAFADRFSRALWADRSSKAQEWDTWAPGKTLPLFVPKDFSLASEPNLTEATRHLLRSAPYGTSPDTIAQILRDAMQSRRPGPDGSFDVVDVPVNLLNPWHDPSNTAPVEVPSFGYGAAEETPESLMTSDVVSSARPILRLRQWLYGAGLGLTPGGAYPAAIYNPRRGPYR